MINWTKEHKIHMSVKTKTWFESIEHLISSDNEHLRANPGMLMGMMNVACTTLGLLPANYKMDRTQIKVMTLRSSDDSMTVYMSLDVVLNKLCIETNRRNLGICGINMSKEKTFFFKEGFGKYK